MGMPQLRVGNRLPNHIMQHPRSLKFCMTCSGWQKWSGGSSWFRLWLEGFHELC